MLLAEIQSIDPIAKWLGYWSVEITMGSIILRLLIALVLSFLIGIERTSRNHAAGLRTYILVTLGACVAMLTNQFLFQAFGTGDMARLGAQVISGIGFLGAGTIMITSRSQIRGLTTAAGLWASACTGLAVGSGFYTLGIVAALLILICFTVLQGLETYFKDHSKSFTIHIELKSFDDLKPLMTFIREQNITIQRVEFNQAYKYSGLAVYTIYLYNNVNGYKNLLHVPFISKLRELDYVNFIEVIS